MIPKLSEATIRHPTIAQSFERGQGYYRAGSVSALIQRGDRLLARVEGSEVNDYQVDVQFDQGGITHATCTCPYNYEGWCKHIVTENARRRAESIINAAQAQYYHHAINWLRRVRAAYLQLGQKEEWQQYRTALMQTHFRKHKLISMLQQRDLT